MGVTIIDNTQVINNATWKVQPDVLTDETGIVKENGTIHYYNGKLKYHANGAVVPLGTVTEFATEVLDYVISPTTATTGNKYLMDVASDNPYTIAEYNGTAWVYTPLVTGQLIEVLSTGKTYRYDSNTPLTPLTEYGPQKALVNNVPTKVAVSYDVLDYVDTVGTATTGNKYLMDVASDNPYTIAEYNGTAWVYTALFNGQIIEVLATGKTFRYDSNLPLTPLTEYGEQKALAKLTLSRKTDSYTLVYADQLKTIEMNKATANTLTVPADVFVAGNQILITQYGAGQTTISAGAGMTLRSDGGKLKINTQYSMATILFISATEAYVSGNLAL